MSMGSLRTVSRDLKRVPLSGALVVRDSSEKYGWPQTDVENDGVVENN